MPMVSYHGCCQCPHCGSLNNVRDIKADCIDVLPDSSCGDEEKVWSAFMPGDYVVVVGSRIARWNGIAAEVLSCRRTSAGLEVEIRIGLWRRSFRSEELQHISFKRRPGNSQDRHNGRHGLWQF